MVYLGAVVEGVVARIDGEGRQLAVMTEDGEELEFVLDPATAGFTLAGGQTQARLKFRDE